MINMRNSTHKGIVSFLIFRTGSRYIGICKEFGFVEEAASAEETKKKLVNGSVLLLKTVEKNPRLAPSLNVRPPFKYLCLFYVAPVVLAFTSIFKKFRGDMRLLTCNLSSLAYA